MFYIACVVYNEKITEIASRAPFEALAEQHPDVRILLFDNSTDAAVQTYNRACDLPAYMTYISNDGNIGLSKAYNKALTMTDREDWILWTDADTEFSPAYLSNTYLAAKSNQYHAIAGLVYTKTGSLLSPYYRQQKAEAPTIQPGSAYDELYCINSGLCVKRSVYETTGPYDEGLFIDMIDYWLFDELSRHGLNRVYIAGGEIMQDFSANATASREAQLKRYRIYAKDFRHYCDVEHKSAGYRLKILAKRKLNILFGSFLRRK